MKTERRKINFSIWIVAGGILAVTIVPLIYAMLGTNSYVQVHDQMDGEILNYIYQAKYLFEGSTIPEFMNGMSKAAMTLPAPLGVLFYKCLPPFAAYVTMQWFVLLTGFLGMFGLCRKLGLNEIISAVTGLLFAYMPFYPTYGLTSLGQPMLILCFWLLLENRYIVWAIIGIVLYAGMSSLTLIGYVWVCLSFVTVIIFVCLRKKQETWRSLLGFFTLTGTYLITNLELLGSLIGKESFQTHRSEMALHPTENLGTRFLELFFYGGSYSKVYSGVIFVAALFALIFCIVKKQQKKLCIIIVALLSVVSILDLLAVLWNSAIVVNIRLCLGSVFTYFQADRVYFIFPFIWMLIIAFTLQIFCELAFGNKAMLLKVVMFGCSIFLCGAVGFQIFRDATLNKNIRLLCLDDYKQVTWESIYMPEVFEKIDTVIGEKKELYSVVSLGIYPSVALYNGYTCADGYSNNYDLEYKHAFRKIISDELAKNEVVRSYFDDWGNRLYVATAERGFDALVSKLEGYRYEHVSLNVEAMKALNIRYIFSAAPIGNADFLNMTLVEGSPFDDEDSYYEIWIYELDFTNIS